jgi:tRNA pseudouridine55 synthase
MGPDGLLLVDKPPGVTSHDVVEVVRRKLATRRVGHAGTLDPMAQGLLVLLVGAATKHQRLLQAHDKTYEALLRLGAQTDTGDAEGLQVRTAPVPPLTRDRVASVLASFVGSIEQVPPPYSAVKVRGRPAYWWARRRQLVALPPRTVRVEAIELLACEAETVAFRVDCSAGTYVRTLAEAIAERLGTVGHLAGLTRRRVGSWRVDEARPLAWIREASAGEVAGAIRPVHQSS